MQMLFSKVDLLTAVNSCSLVVSPYREMVAGFSSLGATVRLSLCTVVVFVVMLKFSSQIDKFSQDSEKFRSKTSQFNGDSVIE